MFSGLARVECHQLSLPLTRQCYVFFLFPPNFFLYFFNPRKSTSLSFLHRFSIPTQVFDHPIHLSFSSAKAIKSYGDDGSVLLRVVQVAFIHGRVGKIDCCDSP